MVATEANGCLIAAAPDMLDALVAAKLAFHTSSASNGAIRNAYKLVNAAIDKATKA